MTQNHITISTIVAVAENGVIGAENKMLWHIPADFKHYKETTMGKPLIMGRKTFESIIAMNGKPLPGRTSIVISRSGFSHEGAVSVFSLEEAITTAKAIARRDGVDEIFINGGGQIYAAALPLVTRLYLTRIHRDYVGDTGFPPLNAAEWTTKTITDAPDHDPPFSIQIWERS